MKNEMCNGWLEDHGRDPYLCEIHEWTILYAHAKFCLVHFEKWAAEHRLDNEIFLIPNTACVKYEPIGVVCVMGSWNFPFTLVIRPMVEAITAGNCVLIKPNEKSPRCAQITAKFIKSYLDPQAVVCLNGKVELSKKLTK